MVNASAQGVREARTQPVATVRDERPIARLPEWGFAGAQPTRRAKAVLQATAPVPQVEMVVGTTGWMGVKPVKTAAAAGIATVAEAG